MSTVHPRRAQAMEALERANHIRFTRKRWKDHNQALTREAGLRRMIALLSEDPIPDWAETWRLTEILGSIRQLGKFTIRRLLNGMVFSGELRIGFMTDRQRNLVINWAEEMLANKGKR